MAFSDVSLSLKPVIASEKTNQHHPLSICFEVFLRFWETKELDFLSLENKGISEKKNLNFYYRLLSSTDQRQQLEEIGIKTSFWLCLKLLHINCILESFKTVHEFQMILSFLVHQM